MTFKNIENLVCFIVILIYSYKINAYGQHFKMTLQNFYFYDISLQIPYEKVLEF